MKNAITIVLVSVLFLTTCTTNRKEKLVIYSPHGKELLGEFENLYEQKYPQVDIQWLDMSSQSVFDRISTESENPQADIWWGAPSTMFMRAEKLGLLEKYKPTWADHIAVSSKSKDDFWYATFNTPEVIAFNNKKIQRSDAPQDWNDIVDPKWKDKVVMRDPVFAGTLRAIFCVQIQQSLKNTGKEDSAWRWIRALHNNVREYATDPSQMHMKLGGDSQSVTLWNMPDIVMQKYKKNFPFDYIFPESGTVVLSDCIAIVKGTKNKALARSFYEFVTTKENLILQAEKFYRIPARPDIERDQLPGWLSDLNYKELDIDWALISENEDAWMKRVGEITKSGR